MVRVLGKRGKRIASLSDHNHGTYNHCFGHKFWDNRYSWHAGKIASGARGMCGGEPVIDDVYAVSYLFGS